MPASPAPGSTGTTPATTASTAAPPASRRNASASPSVARMVAASAEPMSTGTGLRTVGRRGGAPTARIRRRELNGAAASRASAEEPAPAVSRRRPRPRRPRPNRLGALRPGERRLEAEQSESGRVGELGDGGSAAARHVEDTDRKPARRAALPEYPRRDRHRAGRPAGRVDPHLGGHGIRAGRQRGGGRGAGGRQLREGESRRAAGPCREGHRRARRPRAPRAAPDPSRSALRRGRRACSAVGVGDIGEGVDERPRVLTQHQVALGVASRARRRRCAARRPRRRARARCRRTRRRA